MSNNHPQSACHVWCQIISYVVCESCKKKMRYNTYPGVTLKVLEGHLKIIFLWKRWSGTSGASGSFGKEISTFARQSAWRWKDVDQVKGTHRRWVVVPRSAYNIVSYTKEPICFQLYLYTQTQTHMYYADYVTDRSISAVTRYEWTGDRGTFLFEYRQQPRW